MDSNGPVSSESAYRVGTKLRIREHIPPRPFTGDYGPSPRPSVDWSRWEDLADSEIGRVEFALANPPIETKPPGEAERTLTITGIKTRRKGGGANVVTCFLDRDRSVEYIAKIYDGAHYPLYADPCGIDCMSSADRDYSTEAWAYRIMQPLIGGTVIPAYHGSWTFALDTSRPGQRRWVRMILIELVRGECMLDIILRANDRHERVDYSLLPPEQFRLRVLQNIIDAETTIWWEAAIEHEDVEPRNVIVNPDGSVVLIDFNQTYINRFSCHKPKHPKEENPTPFPPTPIERYWPLPRGFADGPEKRGRWADWIPKAWLSDKELAAEWLIQTYRNSPKYDSPFQDFLDGIYHHRRSKKILNLLEELGRNPAGTSTPASAKK